MSKLVISELKWVLLSKNYNQENKFDIIGHICWLLSQFGYFHTVFILCADVAGGWWNVAACPVLCVVSKVDHILYPDADTLMYLLTDGYHILRRLIWRNTISSDLSHWSRQRTLYLEGSLIKMFFCSSVQ